MSKQHETPATDEPGATARMLCEQVTEFIIIEYAEGRLDADPAAKANTEHILATDPAAQKLLADYRAAKASRTPEGWKAEARDFIARFHQRATVNVAADAENEPAAALTREAPRTTEVNALACDYALALAASEKNLPECLDVSALLPGFTGIARGSVRRPGEATVLTFSRAVARAGEEAPRDLRVRWEGGESEARPFREYFGRWMAEIEIELRWQDAVAQFAAGKLAILPAP